MQRKEKDNRPLRRLVVYSLRRLYGTFSFFDPEPEPGSGTEKTHG